MQKRKKIRELDFFFSEKKKKKKKKEEEEENLTYLYIES